MKRKGKKKVFTSLQSFKEVVEKQIFKKVLLTRSLIVLVQNSIVNDKFEQENHPRGSSKTEMKSYGVVFKLTKLSMIKLGLVKFSMF